VKRLTLVLLLLGCLLFAAVAAAQTATWKRCGSWDGSGAWGYDGPGFGFFNVQAKQVSCRTARLIVRRSRSWHFEPDADLGSHGGGHQEGRGRFWEWTCIHRFVLPESTRSRCLAPYGRRVKWVSAA
jgi:hypothetical protein